MDGRKANSEGFELNTRRLRAGERVCVAVSGGADSVALLLRLVEMKAALGAGVSALHVHHGLRGDEADADETFVRALCEREDVALRVVAVDTEARRAAENEGIEEAARALRYAAFADAMASGVADVIVTAHTLDDQAETVLMKLLRGAWLEGIAGIAEEVRGPGRPSAGRIVRPMLAVRRSAVEVYLRGRGQDWREDSSNADLRFLRNKVRHEVMPALCGVNVRAAENLAHAAALAQVDAKFWDGEMARVSQTLILPGKPVRGGGRAAGDGSAVAFEIERLRALPEALWGRVVREAGRQVGARMNFEETAKVLALAGLDGGTGGRVGARLELRDGLRVERSAREVRFSR